MNWNILLVPLLFAWIVGGFFFLLFATIVDPLDEWINRLWVRILITLSGWLLYFATWGILYLVIPHQ